METSKLHWENAFSIIEPQINAEGVHVWSFDPACLVDVRFYAYDKRHKIRSNRHDYFEVFYLYAGELECQIQDRVFSMQRGDLVLINSTQYHTMHLPLRRRSTEQVRAAALYFLPEVIYATETIGEDVEYLLPFLMQDAAFPHVIAASTGLPAQIYELMKCIQAELPAETKRARLTIKTSLKMLLILLGNYYASRPGTVATFQRKQHAIEQLQPLFEFLEAHYHEPISITVAAEIMRLSESHFMRFFKQVTGQSFITYLNHFRVAKAEELLVRTTLTVAEVSQAVGFSDQSYFGLVFRNFVHLAPLQFRQQYQRLTSTGDVNL